MRLNPLKKLLLIEKNGIILGFFKFKVFFMLVSFSFKNVFSFKDAQNLSLEISPLKKDDILSGNVITSQDDKLLKSVLIYGANASGKTNLMKAVGLFKKIVMSSYSSLDKNLLNDVTPFLLDENNKKEPSEFEVIFIENNIKYRYGISIYNGEILEEWLYYSRHRETMLFFREGQSVEYNMSGFKEASLFVKLYKDYDRKGRLEKTAPKVPFISVLAVFEGKHSSNVIKFFSKIRILSGLDDESFKGYTFNLLKENKEFYTWALKILKDFNISGIVIKEREKISPEISLTDSDGIEFKKTIQLSRMGVGIKKYLSNSKKSIEMPISLESSGTRKILHLLGPLYDSIKHGNVLFIDEFDSKFHTLLSKHIFKIFHKNCKNAQLVVNVQDTNLMDTGIFRRDQIWFVHKDLIGQDSQLYSLAEYKNIIKESYSQDYLQGEFDAIPLFDSINDVDKLMVE